MPSFQEISLRFTSLNEVQPGAFCGLQRLLTLKLEYNKLNKVPELTPVKLTLRDLYLSENELVRFPYDYFEGFMQLERLEVTHNHLVAIPSFDWVASSLRSLNLQHNHIASLDGINVKTPFMKLNAMRLNENKIREFDVRMLKNMPKLNYLLLNGNCIQQIDDYRRFYIYRHGWINISLNPFHCSTTMAWISNTTYQFTGEPTCATPWCLKGRVMLEMSKYFIVSNHRQLACLFNRLFRPT